MRPLVRLRSAVGPFSRTRASHRPAVGRASVGQRGGEARQASRRILVLFVLASGRRRDVDEKAPGLVVPRQLFFAEDFIAPRGPTRIGVAVRVGPPAIGGHAKRFFFFFFFLARRRDQEQAGSRSPARRIRDPLTPKCDLSPSASLNVRRTKKKMVREFARLGGREGCGFELGEQKTAKSAGRSRRSSPRPSFRSAVCLARHDLRPPGSPSSCDSR